MPTEVPASGRLSLPRDSFDCPGEFVKVCAIQFAPLFKQPRANLARLAKLVKAAVEGGAKLIVLPELATTGYSFMSAAEAAPFAEVVGPPGPFASDKSLPVMRLFARQWDVCIVWGMIEKDAVTGKLYNSQCFVDPSGEVVSYRKVNQWGNDYIWCTPGDGNPPVVQAV